MHHRGHTAFILIYLLHVEGGYFKRINGLRQYRYRTYYIIKKNIEVVFFKFLLYLSSIFFYLYAIYMYYMYNLFILFFIITTFFLSSSSFCFF
jgi:hypothetical protein